MQWFIYANRHPDQLKLFHYTPTMDMTPIYERIAALAKTLPCSDGK